MAGEQVGADGAAGGEDDAALDDVFELAHVAGPLVVDEGAHGFRSESTGREAVFVGVVLEEVSDQGGDVFAAAAQGGSSMAMTLRR